MSPRRLPAALLLALALGSSVPAAGGAVEVAPGLRPLEPWLHHEDPVLRALAAFELRAHAEAGAVALLSDVLVEERDDLVLGCALGSLRGRPRVDLVAEGGSRLPALLLRLAEHPHPVVRDRAFEVLRTIATGTSGLDREGLGRWWIGARHALDEEQERLLEARRAPAVAAPAPAAGETHTGPDPSLPDLYDHVEGLRIDGLEVVIVMDHTGSMAPVIGAATARARRLVRRLQDLVPRFRAGLVTYDDAPRLRLALTVDGEALEKAFRKVTASGGGDWEEGVDKGIALALRQEEVAWSRNAHRVIVVIGDAPPHEQDVPGLLARIRHAQEEDLDLFRHPVVIHTVSTQGGGVDHFGEIAAAGGGRHVTLESVGRLEEEIVALAFGAAFGDRVRPWLAEVDHLTRTRPAGSR